MKGRADGEVTVSVWEREGEGERGEDRMITAKWQNLQVSREKQR